MGRVFDDVYFNGLFSFILNQYNCFRPPLESYLTSVPNKVNDDEIEGLWKRVPRLSAKNHLTCLIVLASYQSIIKARCLDVSECFAHTTKYQS